MTTTSAHSRPSSIACGVSSWTISSGRAVIMGWMFSLRVSTRINPAPLRNAASPVIRIAPAVPRSPPIISSRPWSPLWDVGRRGGSHCASREASKRVMWVSCPASQFSSPRALWCNVPTTSRALPVSKPGFRAIKVTVRAASIDTPGVTPVCAIRPEGISSATTGAGCALARVISAATSSRGARISPVPSRPSTITSTSSGQTISGA
ncbi:Uncharacterised protein [Enterobacter cloacae]|nr:Uncharacterised protein [Enterobacter cloacae]